jgi:alpha-glucosidase (family GH31 glycosyl hydrolase)
MAIILTLLLAIMHSRAAFAAEELEGLVGRWRLDGDANDSSGNNNHGALLGNPQWVAGKIGGALAFDGDDAVDLGNPSILDFGTGPWTVCAWIKTDIFAGKRTVFANGGDEGGGIRYTLCVGEHDKSVPDAIGLTVDDDDNKIQPKGETKVRDGRWHHVVGMRDGTALRVYVDGVLDGTKTIPAGYDLSGTSQHNACIGAIWHHEDDIPHKYFAGLIDDILIYNRALTQKEIQGMIGKHLSPAREATDVPEEVVSEVKALLLPSAGAAILSVEDVDRFIELKTSELKVRVLKDPWQISVFDKKGRLLTQQTQGKALQYGDQRVTRVRDHKSLGRVRIVKRDPPYYHAEDEAVIVGESVRFNCETSENEREAQVYITFRSPAVFSVWMTVPEKIERTRDVFESSPSEHFFGLGECWNAQSLDLKGLSVTMSNKKGTPDQGGYVPFYLSTKGYGILVDNYLKVKFDFSDDDSVAIEAPSITDSEDGDGYFKGASMLWYFYYGPDLLDVIDRYTKHVSRPAMPPSWALFTTWQWRDTSDEKVVYEDARGMREARIPCGLIWVDRPWATGNDNMPPPFEWQQGRFPDGHKMFMDLNEMGYKTGVWVAKNLYGDMDNPALVRKLKADAQPWLRRDHCQMYKIDRGNTQRMDPYFTCQAYWETWDEVFKGDFVTLPRVIAFRGQKYVNGKWPGDNKNKYDYPSGLRANIAVMLNFAISGFPFWGSDTGGFPDPPGNEVTVRWAQFSSMCPIFQTAGTPYRYPEQYRDIYRKYAELYTRLFPYRWTYATLAHEKGHPICRALALHYPADPNCYNRKYEYLFGEWILVAPVVETATEREVYLPEGKWIDWWDGTVHTGGGTITCSAPLDRLPMLVKAGAIIPMIDVQQTWLESSVDRLTLRVYPEGNSQFTIAGDGKVYPHRNEPYTNLKKTVVKCRQADDRIDIDISTSDVSYRLEVHYGRMPASVWLDGDKLKRCTDKTSLDKTDSGWTFEQSAGPVVWIKVPGQAAARHAIRIMLESSE